MLANRLVEDRDSTCRWQATIVIGEFIASRPEQVWRVARKLAVSANQDIRTASTTVLLEHLLEYHPRLMIPAFRTELARGNRRFLASVDQCCNFGDSRWRDRIQKLLDEVETLRRA